MSIVLNENFWTKKYNDKNLGWDIGYISTPLKAYFDQLKDKNLKILIPGAGNSYEAEYLHRNGFDNVYVVDIAKQPHENLKHRCPDFPNENLIWMDFFELDMHFDLIIEQTFFCAINPELRNGYVKKMHELLNAKGKLVGLLFNTPLNTDHPPYGGNKKEYSRYFESYFNFKNFEPCYNSIPPRKEAELFMILTPKS